MQQNGRAAIDEIVHHARQAGYNTPPGLEAIIASDANPDTVTFVYLQEPMCNSRLTGAMSSPTSELLMVADSLDCFEADTWAYISDPATMIGEFFEITEVQDATGEIYHASMALSQAYPAGSQVYMVESSTFYIDNITDSLHPRLMIENEDGVSHIYADNIEDLQLTYTLAHGAVADTFITSSIVREINIMLVQDLIVPMS